MTVAEAMLALLDVQGHDTRLDQLHHLQATLPERAARDQIRSDLEATVDALAVETATLEDLARAQKRLDDEVASLGAKRAGFHDRLYGGSVTNPRELQDLQDEIEALGRRIRALEDREIEIMEQVEPVEARLGVLSATRTDQELALGAAETALTVAEAELVVAIDTEGAGRATAAGLVSDDLLATYDKLRAGLGGVAVARLVGNQCGGCHLTLSAMESARLRKLGVEEMASCEECGRILVP
ncbi:MAG: zinc ribbon domain-containing protein [Acidimicrobiales bacterium]